MTAFEKLFGLIRKNEKRTGSDYTATVTRVKDGTAYVQITGAEITDTPVAMSVDAKAGDQVRVRVNGGKAWLTGNDTRPPNDSTADLEKVSNATDNLQKSVGSLEKTVDRLDAGLVKYATRQAQNVACTTRSGSGAYYGLIGSMASFGIDAEQVYGVFLMGWSGASASITMYVNFDTALNIGVMSDISQTIGSIYFGILYR